MEISTFMKKKTLITLLSTAAVVLVSSLIFFVIYPERGNRYQEEEADLDGHPIYSQYSFSTDPGVINIGIQPLYLPTGIIFEAVKRDKILKHALSDLGVTVEYYPFLKGDDVNYFLYKKKLDSGIGGDMPAISAACEIDITIPLVVQNGFDSIITKKLILISDLMNKRIAYPFGSISHYTILNTLAMAGISEKDVKLVAMDVPEMAEALSANRIHAFTAWEPMVAEALQDHPDFKRNFRSMTSGYMYFTNEIVKSNPQAVKQIIAAVVRSFRWFHLDIDNLILSSKWNLEAGRALTGKKSNLSESDIARLAKKDILQYNSPPPVSERELQEGGTLQREYEFLKKLGKVPQTSSLEEVLNSFDSTLFREVLSNSRFYRIDEFDYSQ